MKKKISQYLRKLNIEEYGPLDHIFEFYVSGKLETLLFELGFEEVDYFCKVKNKSSYLQVEIKKDNLILNVEFDNTEYDYIIYSPGISVENYAEKLQKHIYAVEFSIEDFIVEITSDLQNVK